MLKFLDCIHRWLLVRRLRRHHAWIRKSQVTFTSPQADERNWSTSYMKRGIL